LGLCVCVCWVFRDRVSRTICSGWLRTEILLISASWVAGIIVISHLAAFTILLIIILKWIPFTYYCG
jgi:hypothetical protein